MPLHAINVDLGHHRPAFIMSPGTLVPDLCSVQSPGIGSGDTRMNQTGHHPGVSQD